jgi:hypothetical protein
MTDAECEQKAKALTRKQARALWNKVQAGVPVPGWDAGKAFEFLVLRAFQLDGVEVTWPYRVAFPFSTSKEDVEQIDGAMRLSGTWFLLESKDEVENIGVAPVAKLRNQLLRRPAGTLGVVFSRTDFTASARVLAGFTSPQTVLLWSGDDLKYAFEHAYFKEGLLKKQRMAVEKGLIDYSLREETAP